MHILYAQSKLTNRLQQIRLTAESASEELFLTAMLEAFGTGQIRVSTFCGDVETVKLWSPEGQEDSE